MFHLITGGSGSGKSKYAEEMVYEYWKKEQKNKLLYIATMFPYGDETKQKIECHRQMRASKQFKTVECYRDLHQQVEKMKKQYTNATVLLECISNLTANELYMNQKADHNAIEAVLKGVVSLCKVYKDVVVVTNEVNAENLNDNSEIMHYRQVIGTINQQLGQRADKVTEVIYGIPVEIKS